MPIQVIYGCPSILYQEKEQFSPIGVGLLGSQLSNGKEQISSAPHL